MPIVDADCHVIESERTWDYLDEGDAKYRPIRIKADSDLGGRLGDECWAIDGRLIRRGPVGLTTTTQESREMISVEARLRHMDELGVDVQVLFPTAFLRPMTNDPAWEIALCKAYNRWLSDIWAKGEGRLRWAAILPFLTIPEALRELETARRNGACAVFIRGFEADRHLGDPYLYPVYEAAAALNMPVCAHAGNSSFMIEQFYSKWGGLPLFKFPVVDAFLSLLSANVPDQFPSLRFGFIEVQSQWVPYAVRIYGGRGNRERNTKNLLPRSRFYVACQTDDDLPYVLRYAGEDNLVIGSDYGHGDVSSEIDALRHLRDMEEVSDIATSKMLDANPTALYGLGDDVPLVGTVRHDSVHRGGEA